MKFRTWFIMLWVIGGLVTGCEFRATTTLYPDGSGELRTEVGFTAEERQRLESQASPTPSQPFCTPPPGQTSANVTVTEEQRGDETWCITITPFDNLDELRRLYESRRGIRINRLEVTDENFYYDIDVDTLSDTSDFSAFTAITWTVILPNAPTYHNATRAEGNGLTWELTPRSGIVNLRAESRAGNVGRGLPWQMAALSLCGGVLVGGSGVLVLRRSRRSP
jgi:hypothetical protein